MTYNPKKKIIYDSFLKEQIQLYPTINDNLNLKEFNFLKCELENSYSSFQEAKEREFYSKFNDMIDMIPKHQQNLYDKTLKYICTSFIESLQYRFDLMPLNPLNNEIAFLVESAAGNTTFLFEQKSDYVCFLKKLEKLSDITNSLILKMREGIRTKNVLPKIIGESLIEQLSEILKNKSWLNKNIKFELDLDYNSICSVIFIENITNLLEFLSSEYIIHCRDTIGVSGLPNGKEKYRFIVKSSITDTNISIKSIHDFGLLEVDRVRKNMKSIQKLMGVGGSLKDFFAYIRERKDLKFTTKNKMLELYRNQLTQIESELLPQLFYKNVKSKCIIEAVPSYNEEFSSEAYYIEGDLQGKRPGKFFLNTRNINQNSKIEIEALTLHETIPGHHYQLSLVNEDKNIPLFMKITGFDAYTEGWAFYSENLGEYKTLESYFGKLVLELIRSIRLVLDTGIHYYGWSYSKAFNYFKENGFDTTEQIESQLIRYISIPGQALSYKMGEKCIIDCLNKFLADGGKDIREFHKLILEDGAVPLFLLKEKFGINE